MRILTSPLQFHRTTFDNSFDTSGKYPCSPSAQGSGRVEKKLTDRETEPREIIYFKLYQSQMPVIARAIETAALMLGSDRCRGYCLEMICADFLAGADLDNGDREMILFS